VVGTTLDVVIAAQPPGASPQEYPSAANIAAGSFELLVCQQSGHEFEQQQQQPSVHSGTDATVKDVKDCAIEGSRSVTKRRGTV
jgi:hypothetical protein